MTAQAITFEMWALSFATRDGSVWTFWQWASSESNKEERT
jgi:hypothetical protein